MPDCFSRTQMLLGKEAMEKLEQSHVAIFGIGGVGTYAAEGLARSGIGTLTLVDSDKVCITNINRQLVATTKTVGKYKTDVMSERISDINPDARIIMHKCFFSSENAQDFDFASYDYVVDAIDTVTSKLMLIQMAKEAGVPVISCMGAGNKLDPIMLEVSDISKTSICPLAKVMRKELRMRGIDSLKVVYSKEPPLKPIESEEESCKTNCVCPSGTIINCNKRRQVPGSVSFVPSVAGLIIAGEVVKDLIKK